MLLENLVLPINGIEQLIIWHNWGGKPTIGFGLDYRDTYYKNNKVKASHAQESLTTAQAVIIQTQLVKLSKAAELVKQAMPIKNGR